MTRRHRTPSIVRPFSLKRPDDTGLDYIFTGEVGGSKERDRRKKYKELRKHGKAILPQA